MALAPEYGVLPVPDLGKAIHKLILDDLKSSPRTAITGEDVF